MTICLERSCHERVRSSENPMKSEERFSFLIVRLETRSNYQLTLLVELLFLFLPSQKEGLTQSASVICETRFGKLFMIRTHGKIVDGLL